MNAPVLRQYGDLRAQDFDSHPVWMCVHGVDLNEPWYGGTDELTYRPWTGPLPYPSAERGGPMVVARVTLRLADATLWPGFAIPPFTPDGLPGVHLSYTQPQIFFPDGGPPGSFWYGVRDVSAAERERFYSQLKKSPNEVFPLTFTFDPGLLDVPFVGAIEGFTSFAADRRTDRVRT
jgi:hypothetical protein